MFFGKFTEEWQQASTWKAIREGIEDMYNHNHEDYLIAKTISHHNATMTAQTSSANDTTATNPTTSIESNDTHPLASDQHAREQHASEQHTSEQHASEQDASEQDASGQDASEQPTSEQQAVSKQYEQLPGRSDDETPWLLMFCKLTSFKLSRYVKSVEKTGTHPYPQPHFAHPDFQLEYHIQRSCKIFLVFQRVSIQNLLCLYFHVCTSMLCGVL